jgi:large subunit ribosomal protein L23
MDATEIILRPLVTEKSTAQSNGRLNTYAFEVADAASKPQIREAVEKLYNVKVLDVRTLVRKGKPRRTKTGYKTTGDYKRAVVKLAEGSKIELF